MTFILRFRNPYGETFFLQRMGDQWPHRPERRLIDATTPDPALAHHFATEEEANEAHAKAGLPTGYDVVEHK